MSCQGLVKYGTIPAGSCALKGTVQQLLVRESRSEKAEGYVPVLFANGRVDLLFWESRGYLTFPHPSCIKPSLVRFIVCHVYH